MRYNVLTAEITDQKYLSNPWIAAQNRNITRRRNLGLVLGQNWGNKQKKEVAEVAVTELRIKSFELNEQDALLCGFCVQFLIAIAISVRHTHFLSSMGSLMFQLLMGHDASC